jgi:uncharacterized repeat protein (TIGR02543 family)
MGTRVFCCAFKTHASFFCASLALAIFTGAFAQTPITIGYRDFNYGSKVFEAPTADKPQSKLWWNDGSWWGVLWNPLALRYRIHRFDLATQTWIEVGPDVDERSQSLCDVLWDGQKLYIVSHVYSGGSQTSKNTSAANSGRLYRYSYDTAAKTYSLDAPPGGVLVNSAISETLVLDKDSTGRLWVTWTQSNKVYLNHSLNDDLTWGTPFALPTQVSKMDSDDISTLIAFNGKIGVVWSNQSDAKIYFSFHDDNKADTDWAPQEVALSDPSLGASLVDDHLNIKMTNDGGGNLFVTTKTSLSGDSKPDIYLLKRSFSGGWSQHVVTTKADDFTRAIVVIDDENRELYVFAKSGSFIHRKKVSLDNIDFPPGEGEPFIESSGSVDINDATSSKHNVNGATGLLILASDEVKRYYYHNYVALPGSGGAAPTISSFTPTTGLVGATVTINGNNFSDATGVVFNGTAANFTVNSNTQITATVPAGATTGKISVTKGSGAGLSVEVFNVIRYNLTINKIGLGSVSLNPAAGPYDAGTMVTLAATPDAGYQFAGWSGDLTDAANPVTITMDADKNVTVTFTALPPPQYTLSVNVVGLGDVTSNPSSAVHNAGTVVTLTATPAAGYLFAGWSGDLTGSTNPTTITMTADKSVTATFALPPPPKYTLSVNVVGFGNVTLSPSGTVHNAGTVVTLTAKPNAGYQLSGWSGAINGAKNPATITMNANKNVTVTFRAIPSSSPIVHQETRTGVALNSTTVITSTSLTGVGGHLYLAAISMRPKVSVLSVTGLGLQWKLVKAKCAGRNTTAIEVWKAQGTPTNNNKVTATFAGAPKSAVIAASRYSGADVANPIGQVIAGNTNGMNGSGVCSGGVDHNTYSFNLNTTVNNAKIYGATAMKARTHTPGAGYAERAEVRQLNSADPSAVAVEDLTIASPITETVNGFFGGAVDWALIALEIKPAVTLGKQFSNQSSVTSYQLVQNYPNPFSTRGTFGHSSTVINFSLPAQSQVMVSIYNETGQLVRTLADQEMTTGQHSVRWNGRNESGRAVAAGMYFYKIVAENTNGEVVFTATKRMTLVK